MWTLIPQCFGYLLQCHALIAKCARLFGLLIALLVAFLEHTEGHTLARSLEVERRREAQLEGVVLILRG